MLVEEVEERYGFQPISVNQIATDELVLAVKSERCF